MKTKKQQKHTPGPWRGEVMTKRKIARALGVKPNLNFLNAVMLLAARNTRQFIAVLSNCAGGENLQRIV